MSKICFTLPWPSASLTGNAHRHWAEIARERHAARDALVYSVDRDLLEKFKEALSDTSQFSLDWIFYAPDCRVRDIDNLLYATKAWQDALFELLGCNDRRVVSVCGHLVFPDDSDYTAKASRVGLVVGTLSLKEVRHDS